MRINLPMDLLRTLVAIVDTGSMVKASEHIYLTQSAISLQMKRLSDIIGQPILVRQQGALHLTPVGERLVASAREILALNDSLIGDIGNRVDSPVRIGMVQDFADAILSGVLSRFKRSYPDVRLEIRVSHSEELKDLFASGLLDIALYLGDPDTLEATSKAQMAWFGDADLLLEPVLPIAIMTKPCRFREAAIQELTRMERPFSITVETPSISVLRAAVESGLAVTYRTFLGNRSEPLVIGGETAPEIAYIVSVQPSADATALALSELITAAVRKI
ncbi:LysR substrate-binding domain-containing protein [Sphingobium subterraneum]|uniref:DNA-binding transcriptional LysR family regulator n=1 Tax=Sphingobium subterraneum TaxID=627688 RepID=A0A841J2S6_9SPHN|nr:LysR substrate-binding domain-containing protein [Sphingobium subterraneum]MBB6125263.1 DNA-binding transcriptional LysR family regulator [Sphingobium subterraneum]